MLIDFYKKGLKGGRNKMLSKNGHPLKFKVRIIIEPDGDGFHAYCPALKGLHVDGDTIEEALKNAQDGATAYLESLIQHGDPIPVGVETKPRRRPFDIHNKSQIKDLQLAIP